MVQMQMVHGASHAHVGKLSHLKNVKTISQLTQEERNKRQCDLWLDVGLE